MVVFITISLYVKDELSFDKFHPEANHIYRLTTSITSPNGQQTKMALANTAFAYSLKENCPEIEDIVCVNIGGDHEIKYNNAEFKHINIREATPSIFDFFEYSVIEGGSSDFLKSPNTIILTETLAKSIFKEKSPIGEILLVNDSTYTVNGVIKDLPGNTDLQFSALKFSNINGSESLVDWGNYFVYCKVNSEVNDLLIEKIKKLTDEKYTETLKQMGGFKLEHHLQALTTIHFDTSLLADTPKGNKKLIYLFSLVAILILIIAGINYINLNIAQLHKKEKDLSIRKIMGCGRKWIVVHVLSESLINFIIAILISFLLAMMLIPLMNYLFNKQFDHTSIIDQLFSLSIIFLASGLLAGIYPAYKITKSGISGGNGFGRLGKVLVIFQNGISIVMIAGIFLIGKQVNYMKDHDLGLGVNKNQIIAINLPFTQENFPGTETIRQEFSNLSGIKSLAFGSWGTNLGAPDYWMKAIMVTKDEEGNDVQFVVNQPLIDENYIDLFGINLIEGRNFDPTMSSDKKWGVIVNQTYVNTMGWTDPLGKPVFEDTKHKVIGVVEDFHFDALYNPIEPLFFAMIDGLPNYLFATINPQNLRAIQNHWEKTFYDIPFEYEFIDQRFAQLYKKNEKEMTIFFYLTLVALLISCLGLYGLTSHFILNRTKEIGIRKVNGAKTLEIISMLNNDFVKWVALAFVIACPIAWYAMSKWLENFAYKTEISWWIFALAGLIALGIALLTVSFQSWRAATRNPVESLRYE